MKIYDSKNVKGKFFLHNQHKLNFTFDMHLMWTFPSTKSIAGPIIHPLVLMDKPRENLVQSKSIQTSLTVGTKPLSKPYQTNLFFSIIDFFVAKFPLQYL